MESSPQNQEDQPITLERATPADLETYLALERSVSNPVTYPAATDAAEALDEMKKNHRNYFIKKDGQIVGNVTYEMKGDNHASITGLMVVPHYQNQGIGREALKIVLDELKEIKRIDVATHPDNTNALALYQSLGFHTESKEENYWGDDGQPRLILAKENWCG
jgi:ribosomal protein S18 acetylase RimI-like enzyme